MSVEKQIILDGLSADERAETEKEINVLRTFKHPYICAYRDHYFDDEGCHIIMEFADGGTIADRLKNPDENAATTTRGVPQALALDWFTQTCLAMRYVHDRKILHRDLKSANIFLLGDTVKIGDFGLARVMSSKTAMAETVLGTPYYMSPELCKGERYDHKSDVWALGCILYEMCTGLPPFQANNFGALVLKIITGRFTPLDEDKFSPQVARIVSSMLMLDPADRPPLHEILAEPLLAEHVAKWTPTGEAAGVSRHIKDKAAGLAVAIPAPVDAGDDDAQDNADAPKSAADRLRESDGPLTPSGRQSPGVLSNSTAQHNHGGVLPGVYYFGTGGQRPHLVEALLGINADIVDVAVGGRDVRPFFVALTADGDMYAWGAGGDGQLGLGTSQDLKTPRLISELGHVRCISAGTDHVLACTQDGLTFAWGACEEGQLGLGSEEDFAVPTLVTALSDVFVKQVAAGHEFSLALTDTGDVYAWGSGAEGQLGLGADEIDSQNTPVLVPKLAGKKAVHIAAGASHAAAALENGSCYCWGTADYGRLGQGNAKDHYQPKRVNGLMGKRIVQVECGEHHTIARDERGIVYTFGDNSLGQFGNPERKGGSTEPTPYQVRALMGKQVVQIAAGETHSCALVENGQLFTWGENSFFRLGHSRSGTRGGTPGASERVAKPTLVDTLHEQKVLSVTAWAHVTSVLVAKKDQM